MRAGYIHKREIHADPVYNSVMVSRFVNRVMRSGKKDVAQKLVYDALNEIKSKGQDPLVVLEGAVNNVAPRMEVRPRRVGGASYQVPSEVRGDRRMSLAIRWLILAAQKRSNKEFHSFSQKLTQELLDASHNLGEAIKKRDQMHKMADANRAFAHFRW